MATAAPLGTDLLCLVTYDERLLDAAGVLGLAVQARDEAAERVCRDHSDRRAAEEGKILDTDEVRRWFAGGGPARGWWPSTPAGTG